jgi:outer membrane protein OmpA-like peptidoglycan-associated protein
VRLGLLLELQWNMRKKLWLAVGLLGLGGAVLSPAEAQRFPGVGGVEGRIGAVLPDDANTGFTAALDLDLGYVVTPNLRTVVGLDYFQASMSERAFGTAGDASGTLTAIGGRVGVRFDLFGIGSFRPYGIAAITGHDVSVSGDTPAEQDLLDREFGGFVTGGSIGAGLAYALDGPQRVMATGEFRRVWNANMPHFAAEIGLRIMPRGARAYERIYRDPWDRRATDAERARAERERLETERRRVDQERLSEDEDARRAEQERMARMTEEERRRAQTEAEEARARTEREAAARAEAEAEAARARQETEAARAEAETAQRRAREAEERLYQSLLDLDRLMASVTGIRETERGLSVVLGQGLFAVGQSDLSPAARDEVGRIAAVLVQFLQHTISVEGHTDSTGSLELNQRLSEQRANAVRAALVSHGIDPGRVHMLGHGPSLPIADNATPAGRAQNRRVEILILGARRPGA